MVLVYCPGPEDSKKVSHVRLGWQTPHQDTQFSPKLHFEDFPDPPDGVFFFHGYLVKLKVYFGIQKNVVSIQIQTNVVII